MTLNTLDAWFIGLRELRHSVVLKLFATVLTVGFPLTLALTAVQVYRDYERGIEQIQSRLVDIDRSYRDSLGEALWRLDQEQLELELEGIHRLADIRAVEVRESPAGGSHMVVSVGERMASMKEAREFPILYRVQDKVVRIGTLYVEATRSNLYRDLSRSALLILAGQGGNTLLIALFTLYVMTRLVTRHLGAIARSVSNYDFHEVPKVLALQRTHPRDPDELERVVSAFNAMAARLHSAYHDECEAAIEREARRTAEAANRAKGEFLANLSHELRTPLNGILGYAQILGRDGTLSARQRNGVAIIQQSGEHLLTLIDETLDFVKVEAGKLRIEISDVSLARIIDPTREIISVKAESRGLNFECTVADDAPSDVRADECRLRQVLLNLLSNAVKFTDAGSVSLRIRRGESGSVRFEVKDTGIGIGAEYREKIFMPFEQASGAERRSGGTGLGLAITRQFVRTMGGEVHIQSDLGQGSLFSFELPAALAPTAERAAGAANVVKGYEGPRLKVLVIDDVQVNRAVVVELLTRVGFDTFDCGNGLDGIAIAQAAAPDIILTDILMPGVDGFEVTRRLRRIPQCAQVPIIAISATPLRTERTTSIDAGVNAFISKPVDFDTLLLRMEELLAIKWTYSVERHEVSSGSPLALLPYTLTTDSITELHQLARDGSMRGVTNWAEKMMSSDPSYAAFAGHLIQLANAYQSKAILQLVEHYLEAKAAI